MKTKYIIKDLMTDRYFLEFDYGLGRHIFGCMESGAFFFDSYDAAVGQIQSTIHDTSMFESPVPFENRILEIITVYTKN